MRVVDRDGVTLGAIAMDMNAVRYGPSGDGAVASGTDRGKTFDFKLETNLKTNVLTMSVTPRQISGLAPAAVVPGLTFLRAMHGTNRLQVAGEHGPFTEDDALDIPEDFVVAVGSELEVARDLEVIQEHTVTQVRYPQLQDLTPGNAARWRRAAALLRGEQVRRRWTSWIFTLDEAHASDFPVSGGEVIFSEPLRVPLNGGDVIDLGFVAIRMETAIRDEDQTATDQARNQIRVRPKGPSDEAVMTLISKADVQRLIAANELGRVFVKSLD